MNPNGSGKIVPVVLSGGAGARLWPVSREEHPKQFYGLLNPRASILQETIGRVSDPEKFYPPIVVGNDQHRFLIVEQLKGCGIPDGCIIIEPCARNTAPAVVTAALYVREHFPEAPAMLVLPTDQHIPDCRAFLESVQRAAHASEQYHITFGVKPDYAETGYGYIRRGGKLAGDMFAVSSFVEKPDPDTARRYLDDGGYFWNSGIFLFSPSLLLKEMEALHPDIFHGCGEALAAGREDLHFLRLHAESYRRVPSISIDYALMERTQRAAVVPLDCGWSDMGAWESLWRLSPKDGDGNAAVGECYAKESRNCYLRSEHGPMIAAYGVENLVIVATKDAVLVATRDHAQSLKALVEHVRSNNPRLVAQNCQVYRPWGMYENLNGGQRYQVKRIHVKPGEKLSLQMHYHRAEHWVVVSGTARVTCDGVERILTENQSIYIPCGSVHRIENPGRIHLEIIEVQSGAYLGEDDIVRLQDQYGRRDAQPAAPALPRETLTLAGGW